MIKQKIKYLKKKIIYRCSHTGTKETDLLFDKLIVNKIDTLTYDELLDLSNLFKEISDQEIFLILKNKKVTKLKFKKIFAKLIK